MIFPEYKQRIRIILEGRLQGQWLSRCIHCNGC
jgi:hypothetical protein